MRLNIPLKKTDLLIHKLQLRGHLILENEQNVFGWTIFADYFTSHDVDENDAVIAHHPNIDVKGRAKFTYLNNEDQVGGEFTIDLFCDWIVNQNKIDAWVYDIRISERSINIVEGADIDVYPSTIVDPTNSWEPQIYRQPPAYRPDSQIRQPFFRKPLSPEHLLNIERKKKREWNERASAPGSRLPFKDTTELDARWEEIKRRKRFGFRC